VGTGCRGTDQPEAEALREQLDPGEAEAIVVAGELAAYLLLLDEKRGRRVAESHGLQVTGLLGVLAASKTRGLLARCQPVLDDMRHIQTSPYYLPHSNAKLERGLKSLARSATSNRRA